MLLAISAPNFWMTYFLNIGRVWLSLSDKLLNRKLEWSFSYLPKNMYLCIQIKK